MYLKQLEIEGYKNFRSPFSIAFSNALNVIVGENSSGKSAIIDALRRNRATGPSYGDDLPRFSLVFLEVLQD